MMDQLSRREKISLLDLPWERPFTIVDLRTYFDLELLVSFYQDMLSPCFKGRQDGARISVLFFAFPCVCERSAYRLSPRA